MEKLYKVTIEGVTPLLMNKPSELIGDVSSPDPKRSKTPEEEASPKRYLVNENMVQPSIHIERSLVEAGKEKKVAGKRGATYSKIVGYAVSIEPGNIEHVYQEWEVFSILVVNPVNKARILCHRPILPKWSLTFTARVDIDEVPAVILKELFDIAGKKVGIGDWRPQKKGKYGKFMVTLFEEITTMTSN